MNINDCFMLYGTIYITNITRLLMGVIWCNHYLSGRIMGLYNGTLYYVMRKRSWFYMINKQNSNQSLIGNHEMVLRLLYYCGKWDSSEWDVSLQFGNKPYITIIRLLGWCVIHQKNLEISLASQFNTSGWTMHWRFQ